MRVAHVRLCQNEKARYATLLRGCETVESLSDGNHVHAHIIKRGYERDKFLSNLLLQMYSECGSLKDAIHLFDRMLVKDVFSWNFILKAHVQYGKEGEAFQLFHNMHLVSLMPDRLTFISILCACRTPAEAKRMHVLSVGGTSSSTIKIGTALIQMYVRCGLMEDARKTFDNCLARDVVCWTALIAAYVQQGKVYEAFQLFEQMHLENIIPNGFTFASILSACANQAALARGKRVHAHMTANSIAVDIFVQNALLAMYSKCGRLKDAEEMFNEIIERDIVSWTSMISAYAQHGRVKDALALSKEMQQQDVNPNELTISSVLAACSHAGLLEQGSQYFAFMHKDCGILATAEHYNCMIDLLGRAGLLGEGEDLISNLSCQHSTKLWMALLGACRMHVDAQRGERAAKQCFNLEPKNDAPYIVLSNILMAEGRYTDAAEVKRMMKKVSKT